ncbi:MAG: hypothetical protein ACOY9C_00790 [Pseudomonadota bacterium]
MISDFVKLRGPMVLSPRDVEKLRVHLVEVLRRNERLPTRGQGLDWRAIAEASGVDTDALVRGRDMLRPGLEALRRELRKAPFNPPATATLATAPRPAVVRPRTDQASGLKLAVPAITPEGQEDLPSATPDELFHVALDREMRRRHDSTADVRRALVAAGMPIEYSTLRMWRLGLKAPVHAESLAVLAFLERRWDLPTGHFRRRLPHPARAVKGQVMSGIGSAERRRLAWHLPDNFDRLPIADQEEILEWVRRVVVTGATDYRRYQANAMRHRFAVRFPGLQRTRMRPEDTEIDSRRSGGTIVAPPELAKEMADLLAFKTATLSPHGYRRRGTWGTETASQKLEHFGLMFGALAAPANGPVRGFGAPISSLSFALLTVPAVWDWYLQWREQRRGFYTAWEVDMLSIAVALTGEEAGWITQTPALAERLAVIPGLVSEEDVRRIQGDWPAACAHLHRFALARAKEIARVAQVHHDPFEPILAVLEADSPVGEYRKIADEVLALRPCPRRYPLAAAESARAFLMIRLGLHLGFRQKNLRQLLVCPKGEAPRSERRLRDLARGELRWSERDSGWEVFVPASAFKNASSSFFNGRPFRLVLPDIGGLYREIDGYVGIHRARLLGAASDPGTFFVKTVKSGRSDAAYDQNTFYEAWRWIIQRYGIYNPYTGRGAIPGLLPHGPHSVRDVLATHILKQTGSYEQASYAIQDTPETVAQHYGRFLPQDKAAIAAEVLNRAWAAE